MRNFIYKILALFINHSLTWPLIKPIGLLGRNILFIREKYEISKHFSITIKEKLNKKIVLNGPFKGLKYNSLEAYYSALYPKLLGCYESELHQVIEDCCKNKYSEIIDVGCAEGYYAIGLSIRFREAKVFAYDTNKKARELCTIMAHINQVSERIVINSYLSPNDLEHFQFSQKGLIICDCEGYEKDLFNKNNIANLIQCDLIIEIHDFVDITISNYLFNLFKNTHSIQRIKSLDDLDKIRKYNMNETDQLDFQTKKILISEGRPSIMEWFFCKSIFNELIYLT